MQQPNTLLLNTWQPCFLPADSRSLEELLQLTNHSIAATLSARNVLSPGIMAGDAGGILSLFHVALHWEDEVLYEKAKGYLERLIDTMEPSYPLSLSSGMAGVIWLLLYLDREEILEVDDAIIPSEVIQFLCNNSLQQIQAGQYDYMHKGLGTTLALLCSPKHAIRYTNYFEKVIQGLLATAKYHNNGMYWAYPLEGKPANEISIGLSHGLPSIMAIVAKIRALNICVDDCDFLIEKTAHFLLAHKNDPTSLSMYPSMVNLENPDNTFNSRLAWCYGDPGVAAAFIHAGKATGHQEYLEEADRIIDFIARRKDPSMGTIDAGFCHGSLGLAHIFNRFYQYKKDPVLKEQAIHWVNKSCTLIEQTPDNIAVSMIEEEELKWNSEPEILLGIAGLSLTLLSSIAPVVPAWDEIFLLDLK